MRIAQVLAASAALVVTLPSAAQTPPPITAPAPRSISRVQGEIVTVTATSLAVRTADGNTTTVPIAPTTAIYVSRVIPASSIKAGDFVATTNINLDDRSGRATELRVYPGNSGTAAQAGSYPMGPPNTTMTNAPVSTVTQNADGKVLTVRIPGGERQIVLPKDVRVIGQSVLDKSALRPGWHVSVILRAGADGVPVPIQILTGENGAALPAR